MNKILAFAGSNHSASINQQLVQYTATLVQGVEVELLDIRKWDIPIYSIDFDPDITPDKVKYLIDLIGQYDGFIISVPEHNGSTPAFFKNIIDWLSRRSKKVFNGKRVLLMSTSPGKQGGVNNRKHLEHLLPYLGANITATFSLPSFYEYMKRTCKF
ncbi:NAD(P)H-dependent oxidoreductase [Labilibacter sediminis]|nr:NAD(P)H-dependent oxidoreductase [Labilibacter sediminis]